MPSSLSWCDERPGQQTAGTTGVISPTRTFLSLPGLHCCQTSLKLVPDVQRNMVLLCDDAAPGSVTGTVRNRCPLVVAWWTACAGGGLMVCLVCHRMGTWLRWCIPSYWLTRTHTGIRRMSSCVRWLRSCLRPDAGAACSCFLSGRRPQDMVCIWCVQTGGRSQ